MNYLGSIDNIITILRNSNFEKEAEIVYSAKRSASTSSELLTSVVHELIVITKDKRVNEMIGKEVENLRRYCGSIGLTIW